MHDDKMRSDGRAIDWSLTSDDYSTWRPDYPDELYARLAEVGVGQAGQRIVDLATGTGFLAHRFAQQGARVVGVDIASGQLRAARQRAEALHLDARFVEASAEDTGLAGDAWDVVTAGQSWLYFDKPRAVAEVRRLLEARGRLVTCHFCWLPREDEVARASEALVLEHNPQWTAAGWAGVIPERPAGTEGAFDVEHKIVFDVDVRFTRERWRGRIRACRGVGAALTLAEVSEFDEAHASLLERIAPPEFTVRHRVDAHVLKAH
jgi:SAM-dependent methyltransferase